MGGWIDLGVGVSQAVSEASYTLAHFPRRIDCIRIMRIPFYGWNGSVREAEPGHYWIEINHSDKRIRESYGWYPSDDISNGSISGQVKAGVSMFLPAFESDGCINGDSPARRKSQVLYPTKGIIAGGAIGTKPYPWDPHHGTRSVRSIRHPYILDDRSEDEVLQAIREYAAGYKKTSNGRWTFKFDDPAENNCHTFLWQILYHCRIIDLDILDSAVDPHFSSIALGGNTSNPFKKIHGYLNRPEFVDYLDSGAKQLKAILEKYDQ